MLRARTLVEAHVSQFSIAVTNSEDSRFIKIRGLSQWSVDPVVRTTVPTEGMFQRPKPSIYIILTEVLSLSYKTKQNPETSLLPTWDSRKVCSFTFVLSVTS